MAKASKDSAIAKNIRTRERLRLFQVSGIENPTQIAKAILFAQIKVIDNLLVKGIKISVKDSVKNKNH